MRKMFFAAIMAACLVLTGCSGVSQEEYDSLRAEYDNYVLDSNAKIKDLQESNDELGRLLTNANTRADNQYRNYKSVEEKYLDIVNSEEYKWFSRLSDEEIQTLMEAKDEQEYIEAMEEYSLDCINANNKGRIYSYCGNLWYRSETGSYVTFVENNSALNDDDMINHAYADAASMILDEAAYGKVIYSFTWNKQDGSMVGWLLVNVMSIGGEYRLISDGILWMGDEYSHLNDNPHNDKSNVFTPTSEILN